MCNYYRGDLLRADELTIGKDNHFIRKKGSKSLGVIHGEWTNFLKFDDMLYFRSKTYPLVNKYKMDYILPSDSTLREDLQMFIAGNESEAQIIKEKYEDVQRRDRIMREQYVKEIFNSKKK